MRIFLLFSFVMEYCLGDPYIYSSPSNIYNSMNGGFYPNSFSNNWPYGRQKSLSSDGELYIRRPYDSRFYNGMGNQMIDSSRGYDYMQLGPYSQFAEYNKPRFGYSNNHNVMPLMLNGYPMYPKSPESSFRQIILPISSQTVFQGPTVSRLPFKQ